MSGNDAAVEEADPISALIEELASIEERVQGLTEDRHLEIQDVADAYYDWYARALVAIPESLEDKFRDEFDGGTWTNKIKAFIADPFAPNTLYNPDDASGMLVNRYRLSFEKNFLPYSRSQRQMLIEARHMGAGQRSVEGSQHELGRDTARLFVSHASGDKLLVDLIVDRLLILGLGIDRSMIAYTSRASMGIPGGAGWFSWIEGELRNSPLVLAVVTPAYMDSRFSMLELGAGWISGCASPLLARSPDLQERGALGALQMLDLDSDDDLDQLGVGLLNRLGVPGDKSDWSRAKREFAKSAGFLLR